MLYRYTTLPPDTASQHLAVALSGNGAVVSGQSPAAVNGYVVAQIQPNVWLGIGLLCLWVLPGVLYFLFGKKTVTEPFSALLTPEGAGTRITGDGTGRGLGTLWTAVSRLPTSPADPMAAVSPGRDRGPRGEWQWSDTPPWPGWVRSGEFWKPSGGAAPPAAGPAPQHPAIPPPPPPLGTRIDQATADHYGLATTDLATLDRGTLRRLREDATAAGAAHLTAQVERLLGVDPTVRP